ncbi:MAG: long-chain fatty acid--CoA ligase [Bacteroidia bacterium]|nr:long-chain fatty acid--CoA ligase [Bacteroidia bacterium]
MSKSTRLFDYIFAQKAKNPVEKSLGKKVDGQWQWYSTDRIIEEARKLASGLLKLGLKPGDKLAIITYTNRPEFMITDLACQMLGVIDVPVYPTISPGEYEYIFNDASVKYAFVGKLDLYDKVLKAKDNVPSLIDIYTFDPAEGKKYFEDLYDEEHLDKVEAMAKAVKPEDLATLIYTSGTTGNPKGVMLCHTNICSIVNGLEDELPVDAGDPVLSFLPLCHIFERGVIYSYINKSAAVHFTGTDNLGGPEGDLVDVNPVFFTTVPRLLEKVYEKIYSKGLELSGLKKKLFFWALDLTKDYEIGKKQSGWKHSIADKLIYSKWREALGGNVRGIITGASACPAKIMQVFSAAGIPIREGYGLTESSPTISVNSLMDDSRAKIGTVGPIADFVDVIIDDSEGDYRAGEGEILAAGPNIMMGYYNLEEKSDEVFKYVDDKKYLRTGDIGKLIEHKGVKFLKITDRKKELLKTSGGKYVAPAPIENKFKENILIDQMMVVGENKKFVSGLIVPSEEALKNHCETCAIEWHGLEEACHHEQIHAKYQEIVNELNPNFSHIEQIKKFKLISQPWEPVKADGSKAELTPTLKLKRRVILEKFDRDIEEIYDV